MINTKMIVIGVLFFLVANPRAYKLVNTLLSQVGLKGMIFSGGSVSPTGVVIHAAIFTLLFCLLFSCLGVIEEAFIEGAEDEDEGEDETVTVSPVKASAKAAAKAAARAAAADDGPSSAPVPAANDDEPVPSMDAPVPVPVLSMDMDMDMDMGDMKVPTPGMEMPGMEMPSMGDAMNMLGQLK